MLTFISKAINYYRTFKCTSVLAPLYVNLGNCTDCRQFEKSWWDRRGIRWEGTAGGGCKVHTTLFTSACLNPVH